MKIKVKLFASLGAYLPRGAQGNEADLELPEGSTVAAVLGRLGAPEQECHLVLVNGTYTAPSQRATQQLQDGDTLAAWPPVAGGAPTCS